MRVTNKLTALAVTRAKKPGRYADGNNLYLQIGESGSKAWLFRFMLASKSREMGLGPVDLISLAEARDAARQCRKMLLQGIDPIDARRQERQSVRTATAKLITFKECAEKYVAAHEASWRNPKHRDQWKSTLKMYVYPVIGDVAAGNVDTGLVTKIIEPIWSTKTETAGRVRGRIEAVLDWAKVRGFRHGENPARWKGHLDHVLPKRSKLRRVRHHPALPYGDLPQFMSELRGRRGQSARARSNSLF